MLKLIIVPLEPLLSQVLSLDSLKAILRLLIGLLNETKRRVLRLLPIVFGQDITHLHLRLIFFVGWAIFVSLRLLYHRSVALDAGISNRCSHTQVIEKALLLRNVLLGVVQILYTAKVVKIITEVSSFLLLLFLQPLLLLVVLVYVLSHLLDLRLEVVFEHLSFPSHHALIVLRFLWLVVVEQHLTE